MRLPANSGARREYDSAIRYKLAISRLMHTTLLYRVVDTDGVTLLYYDNIYIYSTEARALPKHKKLEARATQC